MKLHTIEYDSLKIKDKTEEHTKFKQETSIENVVYFFFKDDQCLYIGETGKTLSERIFRNTPKHYDQPWFKEGNRILQIELDSHIDKIARKTIEAIFILIYRPIYNKEA